MSLTKIQAQYLSHKKRKIMYQIHKGSLKVKILDFYSKISIKFLFKQYWKYLFKLGKLNDKSCKLAS